MSHKLNGGGREWVSQVADVRFKKCNFRAKNSLFLPKIALKSVQNGQRKGNGGYTPHAA